MPVETPPQTPILVPGTPVQPQIRSHRTPSYRRHRASGQAVVTLSGQDHYLGMYGSRASRREYDRLIAEWLANGRQPLRVSAVQLTVAELAIRYFRFVQGYYVKNGEPTSEVADIRLAIRRVVSSYGRTPVGEFGPLALKAIRDGLVKDGLSRVFINATVGRIRRMFKWGISNELVPPAVLQSLQAVDGLRRGRSEAKENAPVRPVADEHVAAVEPFVSKQVWAMIQLQRLTGMRPGEVTIMRGCDLDTTGAVWEYRPSTHKTEHRDRERIIPIGPRARAVIEPFLKPDLQAYLFQPAEAEATRLAELHRRRRTRVQPSQAKRHERAMKRAARGLRGRAPSSRYRLVSYCVAIARACERAFPPPAPLARAEHETVAEWRARLTDKERAELAAWNRAHRWHPHQLRHTAATQIRKELGLEAAQVMLGHARADVTQIYAEKNNQLAREIAAKLG
ncbi:MAG: hypothetical protein AMXMBFR83_23950 [Phycisphaerae bacterium]